MTPNRFAQTGSGVLVVCTFCVTLAAGCSNPSHNQSAQNKQSSETKSQTPTATTKNKSDTPSPLNKTEKSADSPSAPSRTQPVGHAVAMAGLHLNKKQKDSVFLINDPGDNPSVTIKPDGVANKAIPLSRGSHSWLSQPRECKISFGDSRPVINLADSNPYTIVGAVIVRPSDAIVQPRTGPVQANRMPDLSQDIRADWPGLCAATSAADVLYYAGRRDARLLDDKVIGPAPNANLEADLLIAGHGVDQGDNRPKRSRLTEANSLAFMMNNKEGNGSAAVDIAKGLREWIKVHAAGDWRVDIDFLEGNDDTNTIKAQLNHLQEWAGAIADGGGCIVLLWPGEQWAKAIEFDSNGSEHDPDPQFPKLTHINNPIERDSNDRNFSESTPLPSSKQPLPSNQARSHDKKQTSKTLDELEAKLRDAKNALNGHRYTKALALSTEIVQQSLPLRFSDPRAEQLLSEATRIAEDSSQRSGKNEKPNKMVPTRFNG
ncbi:MAG: hypothetical protein ACR2NF_03985 [Pirellulales bacterium]